MILKILYIHAATPNEKNSNTTFIPSLHILHYINYDHKYNANILAKNIVVKIVCILLKSGNHHQ